MLRKYVTVRNISDKPLIIYDKRFSHGRLILPPGTPDGANDYGLPNDIWMDHRRRYGNRMVDVSTLAPVAETVAFLPTHLYKNEPVMLTGKTKKQAQFVKADGRNSFCKLENWEEHAEAIEIKPESED